MTLIACVRIEGVSVLIGDLLLSTETPRAGPVSLPTIGDVADPIIAKGGAYIAGLTQKIVTINDKLMVAWSGTRIIAASILKQLRNNLQLHGDELTALNKTLSEFTQSELDECQFIGLITREGKVHSFHVGGIEIEHEEFGPCIVGGSGAGRFVHDFYPQRPMPALKGEMRDVDVAVTHALTSVSSYMGKEFLTDESYDLRFGGGYEIGTLTTDGAEKLSDILHLFWRYEVGRDNAPRLLPTMIKVDYLGRDLILQHVRQTLDGGRHSIDDHVVHVIGSPIEPIGDRKPRPPALNPSYLSNYYVGTLDNKIGLGVNTIYKSKKGNGPLKITDNSDGYLLDFDLEHFQKEHAIVMEELDKRLRTMD